MRCFLIIAILAGSAYALPRDASDSAELFVNDDGTVSVKDPYFKNPGGIGLRWINSQSNQDGICKLFGLSWYVKKSGYQSTHIVDQAVVVNENGHFQEMRNWYRMTNLMCEFDSTQVYSDSTLQDEDGATKIYAPRIGNDSYTRGISNDSNWTGVCRKLGYSEHYGTPESAPVFGMLFALGEHGELVAIRQANQKIVRITCR